jgi:hypothetical protein
MTTQVTQVEGLQFSILDEASPKAQALASAMQRVSHATEHAKEKVKEYAKHAAMSAFGAAGLAFGLHAIAEKALEANRELEQAKKTIAGSTFAFSHWQKGVDAAEKYRYSMEQATEIVDKLDESEGKLKIRRAELAQTFSSTEQLAQRHRLSQKEQIDLTEKLAATEKVLGVNSQFAAMLISRASMSGTIMGRDKFGMMLKGAIGDMKKFHKMTEPQRFQAIQKAMGDLVPAAQEMGKGWSGAWFDIKETVEQAFRDLTGPVFKEVVQSLRRVAKHVTELREDGQSLMQVYGAKLVNAFHAVESASKWIVHHWKEILAIWGSAKFAGFLKGGGLATLFGGAAGGIAGGVEHAASGAAASGLAGVAAKTHLVIAALWAFKLALEAGVDYLNHRLDKSIAEKAAGARTTTALTAGAKAMSSAMHEESVEKTFGHLKTAFEAYGLKPGQRLDKDTLAAELRAMGPELAAKQIGMYGIKGISAKSVQAPGVIEESAGRIATALSGFADQLLKAYPELGKKKSPIVPGGPPVNHFHGDMHITQEFKEADPDRVFHKVVRDIDDAAMHQRDSGIGMLATSPGGLG